MTATKVSTNAPPLARVGFRCVMGIMRRRRTKCTIRNSSQKQMVKTNSSAHNARAMTVITARTAIEIIADYFDFASSKRPHGIDRREATANPEGRGAVPCMLNPIQTLRFEHRQRLRSQERSVEAESACSQYVRLPSDCVRTVLGLLYPGLGFRRLAYESSSRSLIFPTILG